MGASNLTFFKESSKNQTTLQVLKVTCSENIKIFGDWMVTMVDGKVYISQITGVLISHQISLHVSYLVGCLHCVDPHRISLHVS